MKHTATKFFIFLLLLAHVACKKEDNNIAKKDTFSIAIEQNDTLPVIVTSKDEIIFDLSITPVSTAKIRKAVLSLNEQDLKTATVLAGGNQIDLNYTYEVTGQDVGKSLIFKLIVSDEEDRSVHKDFIVYIQSAPADIEINIPSEAPSEVKDNELADFDIAVTSENDIKYIKTFLDREEITALTKEAFVDPNEDAYHFAYQPTVADADKTLSFTIEVMDVLGNIVKQTYALSIRRSEEADFNSYYGVNIGAQKSTTVGPFFNSSNGEVYETKGVAAKAAGVDLVNFYSGSTHAYNLVSPTLSTVATYIYTAALYGEDALNNWSVRNKTLIKKVTLTREDFDLLASSAAIEALYTDSDGTASESSGGLADNNVLVFKTSNNKYGVIFVKSRSANANTGYLTIDVKVQK